MVSPCPRQAPKVSSSKSAQSNRALQATAKTGPRLSPSPSRRPGRAEPDHLCSGSGCLGTDYDGGLLHPGAACVPDRSHPGVAVRMRVGKVSCCSSQQLPATGLPARLGTIYQGEGVESPPVQPLAWVWREVFAVGPPAWNPAATSFRPARSGPVAGRRTPPGSSRSCRPRCT